MRLIDADSLLKRLGMSNDCNNCTNCSLDIFCLLSSELFDVCDAINESPTIDINLLNNELQGK